MTTANLTPADAANIQAAIDAYPAGTIFNFAAGAYSGLLRGRYDSLIYVEKPLTLNFNAGAVLTAADGQTALTTVPEIAFGVYDIGVGLNDLQTRFSAALNPTVYVRALNVIVSIASVSPANGFAYDTYSLTGGSAVTNQPIVAGQWITLGAQNMEVMFSNATGHSVGDKWYVYPTISNPLHGIRVGRGFQENPIDGVTLLGNGDGNTTGALIDMRYVVTYSGTGNIQPHSSAQEIAGNIFYHGRVTNLRGSGFRLQGFDRSIMGYGEHTGRYLSGGGRGPGTSYDCDQSEFTGNKEILPNNFKLLFGHPSHRGRNTRVSVVGNVTAGLEPNFRAWRFDAQRNILRGPSANEGVPFTSWRHGCQNVLVDNTYINGAIADGVPNGWPAPIMSERRNNVTNASAALTALPWADAFPVGATHRLPLTIAKTLFTAAPGKFMALISDAATITAIGGAASGANLRAAYDTAGTQQIPVKRILDDTGTLVQLALGVTINQIATDTTIYLFRGDPASLSPAMANPYGAFNAEFDKTLIMLSGDVATNSIIASRDVATGAINGKAQSFTTNQSELARDVLDDDTRLMADGLLLSCAATVAASGRHIFAYGTLNLFATPTQAIATLGNIKLTATISGTPHLAVHLAGGMFSLLVNGAVAAQQAVTTQHTRDQALRIGGPREGANYANTTWDATLDDIMVCTKAPSLAAYAGYVALARNQTGLTLGAAVAI